MSNNKKQREIRIKKEVTRLRKIFTDLEENKKKIAYTLIDRASFLLISLEDYEEDMNENGTVELFSQAEHQVPYERARPVFQQHNSASQNYQKAIKQLTDLLPSDEKLDTITGIVNGLQKPR